jgi:hypothetical protein
MVQCGSYEVNVLPDRLWPNLETFRGQGLDMNPDFQRAHVWSWQKQQKYIEFILRGGRTGRTIYLNCPSWQQKVAPGAYNDFVIVDGKQRCEAWRKFYANELKVFGSYASEFTDTVRMATTTMLININDLKSKREVLQWYLDFNSGGVIHTESELNKVRNLLAAC